MWRPSAADQPEAGAHRLPEADGRHALLLESGSRLASLWTQTRVNSIHHQALATSGRCQVVARADDGVIEAIEGPEGDFVLGLQWHPEKHPASDRAALFQAFVAACRAGRSAARVGADGAQRVD